jgi:hypothetical protein
LADDAQAVKTTAPNSENASPVFISFSVNGQSLVMMNSGAPSNS